MKDLPKAYDPKIVEKKWYHFWEKNHFFKANAQSSKPPYCIVMPPPNVTGVLHMGHALVDTLQDILIRWHRMKGFETLWVPGTDHAGIATQTVVERNLYAETGKKRADFTREEFLEHVWDWKEKSETQILAQIKELGCSCDWSRLKFTMDEGCNKAVRACFKKMFDEGLIYRGDYLVNWDPVLQTALSDDEVEFEEQSSFLWHLRYPIVGGGHISIATTRPETMLGDTAVAVHPKDERYTKYIGKMIALPLSERLIPIIADPFVDPEFGTGAVKITPAHDFNDFEMGQRHQLPMINIMTPDGKIKEGPFANLSMLDARVAILNELKKNQILVKTEPHTLRVGVSYRSKAIIQPYLSKQWFIRMSHFKEGLLSAVREKKVRLIPPHWEETYFHWIENVRDWCISRQLWWGHRIPIWYKGDQMVCYESDGTPPGLDDSWKQDPDVLDTWFSSALWPLSTLGWPEKMADLTKFYPTAVLVTGHDILFFWVARMIMMGQYLQKEVPFKESFLHGLIYGKSYWRETGHGIAYVGSEEKRKYDLGDAMPADVIAKWEKMSKSKGNVIDPIAIVNEYGADAMRFALCASTTMARQIDLDLRRFEEFKNFANKIWNGSRFVFMNLEDFTSQMLMEGIQNDILALEDRWMLSKLNLAIAETNRHLEQYSFEKAAHLSYDFFWNDFCAIYLEIAKPVLFGKKGAPQEKANKQRILVICLCNAIRLMHPISPFITEEIFSLLQTHFQGLLIQGDLYTKKTIEALLAKSCIVAPYPEIINEKDINETIEKDFSNVLAIVHQVRNIRAEMQIPPSEKTEIFVSGTSPFDDWSVAEKIILALTPTKSIAFTENEKLFGASSIVGQLKITIPIPESLKLKERERLEKERAKLEKLLEMNMQKLENKEFAQKAPRPVVEKIEIMIAETKQQLAEITNKLLSL